MFNICDEAQREQNSSQVKTQTLKEKKKTAHFISKQWWSLIDHWSSMMCECHTVTTSAFSVKWCVLDRVSIMLRFPSMNG